MREKKWKDCPVCGREDAMAVRRGLSERFQTTDYGSIDIGGLDGQFCGQCGEGFWSLASEKRISSALAKHMAEVDACRMVASELASVPEAASVLGVSRQAVHKMMDEGRLRYVQTPSLRLPIRFFLELGRLACTEHAQPKKSPARPVKSRRHI